MATMGFMEALESGLVDMGRDESGLYAEGSLLDEVCRGMGREELIERFGIDCGYHMSQTRSATSGVDRMGYKLAHVRERCGRDAVAAVIEGYVQGRGRDECLSALGIADKRLTLRSIAESVGLGAEFSAADSRKRKADMERGMVERYGTDNPFKLDEFQDKAMATRIERYGAPYTLCEESTLCDGARATMAGHMADPGFRALVNLKRMLSRMERMGRTSTVERGSRPQAVLALPSGRTLRGPRPEWDRADRLEKARVTSVDRFGADHHSKTEGHRTRMSELWAEHGEEWNERRVRATVARYGVASYAQTKEAREAQRRRMLDASYQKRLHDARKRNGTFTSSGPEDLLYVRLVEEFGAADVEREYREDARYPYSCDFYVRSRDLFIELNGFMAHGGRWCDSDEDRVLAEEWAAADSGLLRRAAYVWSTLDVNKREHARLNRLNYVVFWDGAGGVPRDAELWLAMGCPDGRDWERMYSWLPERSLEAGFEWPRAVVGTRSAIDAAKCANGSVFYAAELAAWKENRFHGYRPNHFGTPQAWLYANRLEHVGKLPGELTDRELLRGFKASGLHIGYSSFDAGAMREVIERHGVTSVLDPCAGWGERLATAGAMGLAYHGVDANPAVVDGHSAIVEHYGFERCSTEVGDGAAIGNPYGADVVITCPPYGGTETYSEHGSENLDEEGFLAWWGSVAAHALDLGVRLFAFQVSDVWRDRMLASVERAGWSLSEEVAVASGSMPFRKGGRRRRAPKETMLVFERA